ncbi:ATP synthase delta chain [Desulfocucumis palustris]|uniref:ATP synthase subunit delta n=1 Tax=Desulfocucumis palustris TaxID=1898651 RepID=A0A2L2XHC8_9FIRM|nr:F0F1 ATP synthase subunit delta [Desulfocucumis palustris]GBF35638.1 ATP synthase delta chain [Desulfocucumis palustris]
MLRGAVGGRYAEALYELAKRDDKVDVVEQELKAIDQMIKDDKDLQKILYHPRITAEEKKDLLKELFAGKISEVTFEFLKLLVERQREQFLSDIVDYFVDKANADRNITAAGIASAVELNNKEKADLEAMLGKITGKKVVTDFSVDPSLIGGVVVRIGDRVIDGSIRTRLAAMREHLRLIS